MTIADGFYRYNSADRDKKLATSVDDATGWNTLYVKVANPNDFPGGVASSPMTDAQFIAHLPLAVNIGTSISSLPNVTIASMPSVAISNWPATQPVSIANPVAVTGTFWQATQPVSATTLPLPTNAAAETGGNLATAVAYLLAIGNQNANIVTATQTTATSGSTAANQATEIVSLASVDSKLGTIDSRPSAFSVLERLFQLSVKMDKLATEATLRQLVAKPVAKPSGTLLHR